MVNAAEMPSNFNVFRDNRMRMVLMEAPAVFLIPISLVRCAVLYEIKPSKPRHEINMESMENTSNICPVRRSGSNSFPNSSSSQKYSKGYCWLKSSQVFLIKSIVAGILPPPNLTTMYPYQFPGIKWKIIGWMSSCIDS